MNERKIGKKTREPGTASAPAERSPVRVVRTQLDAGRQDLPEPVPSARRILVADDEVSARFVIETLLKKEGYQVVVAGSGEEALSRIHEWNPDLVLMDYDMPGLNGLETVRLLRERKNYVATLFVSSSDDERVVTECLKAGADDFIRKPIRFSELLERVRVRFRIKDLHDALEKANLRLKDMADRDFLTGLFNLRVVFERLDAELARSARTGAGVACIMMDMDNFKSVNDENDHLIGSQLLKEVGWLIQNCLRPSDFACRYGGDEFLIVLTETSPAEAEAFAESLRRAIADHTMVFRGKTVSRSGSFGVAVTIGDEGIGSHDLARRADAALYVSKRKGRDRVTVYEPSMGSGALPQQK